MTEEAKRVQAQRTTQQAIEALPNPIFFTAADGRYSGVKAGINGSYIIDMLCRENEELFAIYKSAYAQVMITPSRQHIRVCYPIKASQEDAADR